MGFVLHVDVRFDLQFISLGLFCYSVLVNVIPHTDFYLIYTEQNILTCTGFSADLKKRRHKMQKSSASSLMKDVVACVTACLCRR